MYAHILSILFQFLGGILDDVNGRCYSVSILSSECLYAQHSECDWHCIGPVEPGYKYGVK